MAKDIVKSIFLMLLLGIVVMLAIGQVYPKVDGEREFVPEDFEPNIIFKYMMAFAFVFAGYSVWLRWRGGGIKSPKDFFTLAIAAGLLLYMYLNVFPDLGIIESIAYSLAGTP